MNENNGQQKTLSETISDTASQTGSYLYNGAAGLLKKAKAMVTSRGPVTRQMSADHLLAEVDDDDPQFSMGVNPKSNTSLLTCDSCLPLKAMVMNCFGKVRGQRQQQNQYARTPFYDAEDTESHADYQELINVDGAKGKGINKDREMKTQPPQSFGVNYDDTPTSSFYAGAGAGVGTGGGMLSTGLGPNPLDFHSDDGSVVANNNKPFKK